MDHTTAFGTAKNQNFKIIIEVFSLNNSKNILLSNL